MKLQRGWFYLADLNPRQGTEPGKTRPVLVVQTDLLNQVGHPSSLIIPVTTNIVDEAKPLRVRIKAGSEGFSVDSDLMIDQMRAIDNRRLHKHNSDELLKRIARVESGLLREVEDCLKKVLDLK
ncbi:type II toxin-antitoxin system PemK/MazF family toxin [candidate division KSB1 bacterium]|nr:type II toxin-antitoxin system PemK/MazF family toxin [candidate division KSB1 bacterium]